LVLDLSLLNDISAIKSKKQSKRAKSIDGETKKTDGLMSNSTANNTSFEQ